MANKFIIILKDGQLTKKTVSKPEAPRKLNKWVSAAMIVATNSSAGHFLFRFHGKWHVFVTTIWLNHCYVPLKTFDEQAAAEMYLLTKGLM